MKRTLLVFFSVVLLVAGSISAFANGQPQQQQATSTAKKQLNFVFMPGVVDPFYYTMQRGAEQAAKKYGVNLIVGEYPKSWGPSQQVPILQATVARGNIDLVFIAPTATDALIAPLKKLYDSGIEIITVDTYLGNGDYSKPSNFSFPLSYIGSDNVAGGKLMAEDLAKLINYKGEVYINSTNPNVSSVNGRVIGFKEGIAKYPNIKLVGVDYNLDVQQKATSQTSAILQKYPHLAGIFGTNLYSAQGAYHAVVNAGLTGAVKIASWDASQDLINALKNGQINMTLAQEPSQMGYLAVEWGYKYFTEHKSPPKRIGTGFKLFTQQNVNDPSMQKYIYQK